MSVSVGLTGFEPAASSSRTRRATNLRHSPSCLHSVSAADTLTGGTGGIRTRGPPSGAFALARRRNQPDSATVPCSQKEVPGPGPPPTASIVGAVSLYSEVMANEKARAAYLGTTQVTLTANPRHPDTREICEALLDASIAFLFTSNRRRPRPELQSRQMIMVGKSDILEAIGRLGAVQPAAPATVDGWGPGI